MNIKSRINAIERKSGISPNALLPAFRAHFFEVWLLEKAMIYFADKDEKALEFLPYLLPKPEAAE